MNGLDEEVTDPKQVNGDVIAGGTSNDQLKHGDKTRDFMFAHSVNTRTLLTQIIFIQRANFGQAEYIDFVIKKTARDQPPF